MLELTLPQFVELLHGFESNPELEEVRRSARVMIRKNVKIRTDPSSPNETPVVLHDLSRGGVCITHHEGLPRDKMFELLLPRPGKQPMVLTCVVRHCAMVKEHLFRIGAQFILPENSNGDQAGTGAPDNGAV